MRFFGLGRFYGRTRKFEAEFFNDVPLKFLNARFNRIEARCGLSIKLRNLIEEAYQIDDIEVDSPKFTWDQKHCFVIEATMPPGTSKETARLMLQQALAERFGLRKGSLGKARHSRLDARCRGKNGIKIQPDTDPDHPKLRAMTSPTGKTITMSMQGGPGEYFAAGTTLDLFAKNLRYRAGLDRPVVNHGQDPADTYSFDLEMATDGATELRGSSNFDGGGKRTGTAAGKARVAV